MAEVQDAPQAVFVFVLADHRRLDPAAAGDHLAEGIALLVQDVWQVCVEQIEQAVIGDEAVLDHLVEPGAELAA